MPHVGASGSDIAGHAGTVFNFDIQPQQIIRQFHLVLLTQTPVHFLPGDFAQMAFVSLRIAFYNQ